MAFEINHRVGDLTPKEYEDRHKKALEWWEGLPEEMKAGFPNPQSREDIIAYYNEPASYLLPPHSSF
jgi:hypothetical protein